MMRAWQECLFRDTAAYNDFLTWINEQDTKLKNSMQQHLLTGEVAQAQGVAFRLDTYQAMGRSMRNAVNERQALTKT